VERRIQFEGCYNFRDLGGYPTGDGRRVRWRWLFRSDALHHLTARDLERFTGELGIRHVVDLRSSGEVGAEGRGALTGEAVEFHHLPLFDGEIPQEQRLAAGDLSLADRYFLMAEYAQGAIAKVLATLAESEAPAVYHCAAGKDRTGVVSAILLGVLGVRDEIIVADYAASQENLDSIIERLLSAEGYQDMLAALPPDTLHAQPETMLRLLERVRERYGSMEGYAVRIGLPEETLARLRQRLLEPE
jgi:protein-tyrosine phosphatase